MPRKQQEQRYDERDFAVIVASQNFDANESVFFARELETVKSKTYDKKYPNLTAMQNIPVSFEADPGAETITYYQYESTGLAKILANYSNDLPRADVKGKPFTSIVKGIGTAYGYSIQDIRAAKKAGKPLEQRKASAARLANDQKVNQIAYFGDADHGLVGLFTHPNVTAYVLPADGTGSSTKFIDKTPDQVLRDLNGMVNKVVQLTQGVEAPDTLLLPADVIGDLSTRARSANSDTTILEFFLKNSPYIKEVKATPECKGAGAGGADLAMMYAKDPDKLTFEIPQPFEQFPPQAKGLEYEIPCHSRCGGVIIYYPLSLIKASGC